MNKLILVLAFFSFFISSGPAWGQDGKVEVWKEKLQEVKKKLEVAEKKGEAKKIKELQKEKKVLEEKIASHVTNRGVPSLVKKLEGLLDLYRDSGQKKEARGVMGVLKRLGRLLPSDKKDSSSRLAEILALQKKITVLLSKLRRAQAQGQYKLAEEILNEMERLGERMERLSTSPKEWKKRKAKREKLQEKIQRRTDEAVGARLRGDHQRARALIEERKRLKKELAKVESEKFALLRTLDQLRTSLRSLSRANSGNPNLEKYQAILESLEKERAKGKKSLTPAMRKKMNSLLKRMEKAKKLGRMEEFLELWDQLEKLSRTIPRFSSPPPSNRRDLDSIKNQLNRMEKKLNRLLKEKKKSH